MNIITQQRIEERNKYFINNNALTFAIGKNQNIIATHLVKLGFPLLRKHKVATPLHVAVRFNNPESVKLILEQASKQNQLDAVLSAVDENGYTPLHTAAVDGYNDHVKTLLKAGANIDSKDNDGKTPLDLAIDNGREETIKTLCQSCNIATSSEPKPTYLELYNNAEKNLAKKGLDFYQSKQ